MIHPRASGLHQGYYGSEDEDVPVAEDGDDGDDPGEVEGFAFGGEVGDEDAEAE